MTAVHIMRDTPPSKAGCISVVWPSLSVVVCGLYALEAALCYAELACLLTAVYIAQDRPVTDLNAQCCGSSPHMRVIVRYG